MASTHTFGYADLGISNTDFFKAAKAIERLQKKGVIKKISKGVFYKPKDSIFGEVQPSQEQKLKKWLFENGKRIGYITAYDIYNALQLTTQIPATITIANNKANRKFEIGYLRIRTVKAYVAISEKNYKYLQILDVLKDIKNIPDASTTEALARLMFKMKNYTPEIVEGLVKYATYYPPRVRALLGAIITTLFKSNFNINALQQSLTPGTIYKLNVPSTLLPTAQNWNIK